MIQNNVRFKNDDISLKKNMIKWATSQSQTNKVEKKKLELLTKFNKYDQTSVKAIPPKIKNFSSTGGFQKQRQ